MNTGRVIPHRSPRTSKGISVASEKYSPSRVQTKEKSTSLSGGVPKMRFLTCLAAILVVVCGIASAQSPNATLRGQVSDSSGGTIAGASIDAVNPATNVRYSTNTNAEGMYVLPELPPASYEIQVSHSGFKTIVKPEVLLNVR